MPDASSGMFVEGSVERNFGPESTDSVRMSEGFQEKFEIILQELKGITGRMGECFPRPEKPCSSLPRRNCSFAHTPAESKKRGWSKKSVNKKAREGIFRRSNRERNSPREVVPKHTPGYENRNSEPASPTFCPNLRKMDGKSETPEGCGTVWKPKKMRVET